MAIINNINEVLHRIRVKLYPNYLPGVEGNYIARTNNEATLTVEQVCAALKNRGGFTGKYEDLIYNLNQFEDEAAYQLCDGFGIRMKYYSILPNIGGTFNSASESHDSEKNPISFRFRTRNSLRKLIEHIVVEVEGIADTTGWIDEFIDTDENSTNTLYVAEDGFIIHGSKIKIAGDNPGVGLFFVPVDDPAAAVKVTRIIENTPTKIIGITPKTEHMINRIEIRTQYSGSGTVFLKTPRVIASSFTLEEG